MKTTKIDRMLFIYALNGVVKCYSNEELREIEARLLDEGWKHTATIDPARWIEAMANGYDNPSDMLDEIQFAPNEDKKQNETFCKEVYFQYLENKTAEYGEALNEIADILQLPTGVTTAEIVAEVLNKNVQLIAHKIFYPN
jgi:hypothetical protein